MEKLQKVLDAYTRYLNSLKKDGTDIKKNYSAMKTVIERDCEEWFKKHMLQDSIINSLRANRQKYDDIKPSSRIQLLIDSQDNLKKVKQSIVIKKAYDSTEIRFSWLPTLYNYFNPIHKSEGLEMWEELKKMYSIGLVSDTDYQLLCENVFRMDRLERLSKEHYKAAREEFQKEIEEMRKEDIEVAAS